MPTSQTTLHYHGHSCFELSGGGCSLLLDPFLAPNNPVAKVTVEDIAPSHVAISHGHSDHVGDAVAVCRHSGATAYAVFELAQWLSSQGVEAIDLNLGGRVAFEAGTIGFVPAFHSNTLPDGTAVGQAAGIVARFAGHSIYHVGDSSLFSDMALIGEMEQVETMIVPIGGHYTMDVAAAARAVALVKPKRVIPCHYNTFPAIVADPREFASRVEAIGGVEPIVLAPGESVQLPGVS